MTNKRLKINTVLVSFKGLPIKDKNEEGKEIDLTLQNFLTFLLSSVPTPPGITNFALARRVGIKIALNTKDYIDLFPEEWKLLQSLLANVDHSKISLMLSEQCIELVDNADTVEVIDAEITK